MKHIIGTGLSGLVGSRIVQLLADAYTFEDISRKTGTDITDTEKVLERIQASDAEYVFHLAAKTDVDGCEAEKELGEDSEAWKINVLGTQHIIDACEKTNKKLLYVSTDFVFSGNDTPEGGYTEESNPDPINWYGQTKREAELRVQQAKIPWIIVRIGTPYRANFEKKDFVRLLLGLLQQGKTIQVVQDQKFNPTFIDDIAGAINVLLTKDQQGVFHVFGTGSVIPYEAVGDMAEMFGLDTSLIQSTTRAEFFTNRAERPFDLSMNNDKIISLGAKMKNFAEGLAAMKQQMEKTL